MKEHGTHEDCIAHMYRMFSDQIFQSNRRVDDAGRIRMDNFELDADVQAVVKKYWEDDRLVECTRTCRHNRLSVRLP